MNSNASLEEAVRNQDVNQIQRLIDSGVDVNTPLEEGETLLMLSSSRNYIDIVRILVEAGADVNALNLNFESALLKAAAKASREAFSYLFPLTSEEIREQSQMDALLGASLDGDTQVVRLLIEFGTDLNATDEELWESKTALISAAEWAHKEIVEILVEAGADVNLTDSQGQTALMLASKFRTLEELRSRIQEVGANRQEIIDNLVTAGAEVNAQDSHGRTALMLATELGTPETVEYLLNVGTDTRLTDLQGHTVLNYAENSPGSGEIDEVRRSRILRLLQT
jgi:ankyrin repeat protein